jgi:hypothetical protein
MLCWRVRVLEHGATHFQRILAEFQSRFLAEDDCRRMSLADNKM